MIQKQYRFPKELTEKIDARATKEGLTPSAYVRMILTREVSKGDRK